MRDTSVPGNLLAKGSSSLLPKLTVGGLPGDRETMSFLVTTMLWQTLWICYFQFGKSCSRVSTPDVSYGKSFVHVPLCTTGAVANAPNNIDNLRCKFTFTEKSGSAGIILMSEAAVVFQHSLPEWCQHVCAFCWITNGINYQMWKVGEKKQRNQGPLVLL